jgi:predicted aspartyl protease
MIDKMGIFRTTLDVAPLHDPSARRSMTDVMVDTGSEYNWIPAELLRSLGVVPVRIDRFEAADGRILEREVGFALFYAAGRSTPAIAVFALPGDMVLLGAHGLEGMNLRVDLVRRELVPAGPVPAAAAYNRSALSPASRDKQNNARNYGDTTQ